MLKNFWERRNRLHSRGLNRVGGFLLLGESRLWAVPHTWTHFFSDHFLSLLAPHQVAPQDTKVMDMLGNSIALKDFELN